MENQNNFENDNLYNEYLSQKDYERSEVKVDEKVLEDLLATMSEEQKDLFAQYQLSSYEFWSQECCDAYHNGIRKGLRLLYDALREK